MKNENIEDVSEVSIKPTKYNFFYLIKAYLKLLYYKLIIK